MSEVCWIDQWSSFAVLLDGIELAVEFWLEVTDVTMHGYWLLNGRLLRDKIGLTKENLSAAAICLTSNTLKAFTLHQKSC
jgi:hypothetical protein